MSKSMPPVPPAARTTKGPHASPEDRSDSATSQSDKQSEKNLAQQGRQGNLKQNTTNQGYQQDR